MIDLTQIEIELGYGLDGEAILVTRGEMIELITRLRQAEKDAGWYRRLLEMTEVNGATEIAISIPIFDDWDVAVGGEILTSKAANAKR